MPVPARSVYVTGTDTGVGKTMVAEALVHRLRMAGLRTAGMKPVASGCERTPDGLRNHDALVLQAASDPTPAYDDVNPYALALATAPQLAARAMGVRIALSTLRDAHARLAARCDAIVVEGAGGWLAPFDAGLEQADLVRALDLQVVLVVGLRLGCLNHARLSARAIAADGFTLLGWIGSAVDPDFDERDAYLGLLGDALPAPCLGVLPHAPDADPRTMARALALPPGF